ncbi:MAG TPA: hypothetical protein VFQ61_00720 [Polyangiaceae bacterium]|nr:hypothetical protein [Polyangiaceae bacterium]
MVPGESSSGHLLNREALRRLELAHDAGWTADELAELYNELKIQIENTCPGWRADRVKCSDGSEAFVGALGPVLLVLPDRGLFIGHLGATAADGALFYTGMVMSPDGCLMFPPPNTSCPGTRRVR